MEKADLKQIFSENLPSVRLSGFDLNDDVYARFEAWIRVHLDRVIIIHRLYIESVKKFWWPNGNNTHVYKFDHPILIVDMQDKMRSQWRHWFNKLGFSASFGELPTCFYASNRKIMVNCCLRLNLSKSSNARKFIRR
jgi:hypothetical protein